MARIAELRQSNHRLKEVALILQREFGIVISAKGIEYHCRKLKSTSIRVCALESCGAQFAQRPDESQQRYAGRKYCCPEHTAESRRIFFANRFPHRDVSDEPPYVHPPCEVCGEPVLRREGQHLTRWKEQKGCSRGCGKIIQARSIRLGFAHKLDGFEHPPCPYCSTPIVRYEGEGPAHFKNRLFCNKHCAVGWQRHNAKAKTQRGNAKVKTQNRSGKIASMPLRPISSSSDEEAIAAFIRTRGVNKLPPAYAAETQAALSGFEANWRIKQIVIQEPKKYNPYPVNIL